MFKKILFIICLLSTMGFAFSEESNPLEEAKLLKQKVDTVFSKETYLANMNINVIKDDNQINVDYMMSLTNKDILIIQSSFLNVTQILGNGIVLAKTQGDNSDIFEVEGLEGTVVDNMPLFGRALVLTSGKTYTYENVEGAKVVVYSFKEVKITPEELSLFLEISEFYKKYGKSYYEYLDGNPNANQDSQPVDENTF